MKIRQRQKKRPKKLFVLLTVFLVVVCVWRGRSQWTLNQLSKEFSAEVIPVQEKMRMFTELELSFLSGDMTTLPREVVSDPDAYLTSLKQSFRLAVEIYNRDAETPLMIELDSEELLASLGVEQKVAQMFLIGFDGTELSEENALLLETQQPGGVILMGRNISGGTKELTASIQSQADILPFFISIDQEGGSVKRIPEDLPAQAKLSREEVCPTYLERSELLRKQGINLNFGIVADVTDDESSFIYPRVFHGEVEKKIIDAVQCTTENLTTLKHFPGHGMTLEDTHVGVVPVDLSREERKKVHLPAFFAGIQAGVDVIMSVHLQVPRIDADLPVSLSVSGVSLLRAQGFSGLIITDDLGMLRTEYSEKELVKLSLLAGNDLLLLVDPTDPETLITYAADLVREGVLSQQDLDARIVRIIRAKNKIIKLERYVPLELMR